MYLIFRYIAEREAVSLSSQL